MSEGTASSLRQTVASRAATGPRLASRAADRISAETGQSIHTRTGSAAFVRAFETPVGSEFDLLVQVDALLERAGVPAELRLFTGSASRMEAARLAASELVEPAGGSSLEAEPAQAAPTDDWGAWVADCVGGGSAVDASTGGGDLATGAETPESAGAGAGPALSASADHVLRVLDRSHGDVPEPIMGRIRAMLGRGSPLDPAQQARFSQAMDHDLSHVRVHVGGAAADAARAISARAFTVGADVFFGTSEYAPGTTEGDRLLAHELTHVMQHDEGRLPSGGGVSSPTDPAEQEAYANEGRVAGNLLESNTLSFVDVVPLPSTGGSPPAHEGFGQANTPDPTSGSQSQSEGVGGDSSAILRQVREGEAGDAEEHPGPATPHATDPGMKIHPSLMRALINECSVESARGSLADLNSCVGDRPRQPGAEERLTPEVVMQLAAIVGGANLLSDATAVGLSDFTARLDLLAEPTYRVFIPVEVLRAWLPEEAVNRWIRRSDADNMRAPTGSAQGEVNRSARGRHGQHQDADPDQGQNSVEANWEEDDTYNRIRLGPGKTDRCIDSGLIFLTTLERLLPEWQQRRASGTFECPELIRQINSAFGGIYDRRVEPGAAPDLSADGPRILQLLAERPAVLDMLNEVDAFNDPFYVSGVSSNLMDMVRESGVNRLRHEYSLKLGPSAHFQVFLLRATPLPVTLMYRNSHGMAWSRSTNMLQGEFVAGMSAQVGAGLGRNGRGARGGGVSVPGGVSVTIAGAQDAIEASEVLGYFSPEDLETATGSVAGSNVSVFAGVHAGPLDNNAECTIAGGFVLTLEARRHARLKFSIESIVNTADELRDCVGVAPTVGMPLPPGESPQDDQQSVDDESSEVVVGATAGANVELLSMGKLRTVGQAYATDFAANAPRALGEGIPRPGLVDARVEACLFFRSGEMSLDNEDITTLAGFLQRLAYGQQTFHVRWGVEVVGSASVTWRSIGSASRARAQNGILAVQRGEVVISELNRLRPNFNLGTGSLIFAPLKAVVSGGDHDGSAEETYADRAVTLTATPIYC